MIARKQKVVAIIDGEAEGRLEVRTTSTTGMAGKLVHDDLAAGGREADRS